MTTTTRPRAYLSIDQTAEMFGVSVKTCRRMISEGHLIAYRLPGRRTIRIAVSDAERLLLRIPTVGDLR